VAAERPVPGVTTAWPIVPHCELPGHDITGREESVREPQRLEYERDNSFFVRHADDLLDDPPGLEAQLIASPTPADRNAWPSKAATPGSPRLPGRSTPIPQLGIERKDLGETEKLTFLAFSEWPRRPGARPSRP
jgi:hypothetical protein